MGTKPKKSTKIEASPKKAEDVSKARFNTLVVNGDKYKTQLTKKYKNRQKWEDPDDRKIFSDIPGTVIKIYVEEGQKVQEGDMMMVLEAMKMKNKIQFQRAGTVKKIYVAENEKVPKGQLMIELQ